MAVDPPDLWTLIRERQWIDPQELSAALEDQVRRGDLDYRSRLLIRDCLNALDQKWGRNQFRAWLHASEQRSALDQICKSDLGPPGFTSLQHRVMEPTRPEHVLQFLRDLGDQLPHSARIDIGGSIALILSGNLSRNTEDIDVVDEVPPDIRSQHELLDGLLARYGLRLAHFQSHFLPTGWDTRLHSLGRFGRLDVRLVDPYDIFVGKLFSAREKDLDDLRAIAPRLDRAGIESRLNESAASLLADPQLRAHAQRNWHIVFGDVLPITAP